MNAGDDNIDQDDLELTLFLHPNTGYTLFRWIAAGIALIHISPYSVRCSSKKMTPRAVGSDEATCWSSCCASCYDYCCWYFLSGCMLLMYSMFKYMPAVFTMRPGTVINETDYTPDAGNSWIWFDVIWILVYGMADVCLYACAFEATTFKSLYLRFGLLVFVYAACGIAGCYNVMLHIEENTFLVYWGRKYADVMRDGFVYNNSTNEDADDIDLDALQKTLLKYAVRLRRTGIVFASIGTVLVLCGQRIWKITPLPSEPHETEIGVELDHEFANSQLPSEPNDEAVTEEIELSVKKDKADIEVE